MSVLDLQHRRGAARLVVRASDRLDPSGMLPAELPLVSRAVPVRRAQFATARRCARAALADLGAPVVPLLHDAAGRPCWPDGVVGSMTHCAGYAAAVVASSSAWRGVGIDAEPAVGLPAEVVDLVLTPHEQRVLEGVRQELPGVPVDTLAFCVKEAVFKIWSPLTDAWLDHDEVWVVPRADGTVVAELASPLPDGRTVVPGRWQVAGGRIVTVMALTG